MLAEVAVMLLWFNPAVWMLRKEIEKNIEFETDDLMLARDPVQREGYQLNLLRIATDKKPLTITTNYNQSLIKQRILRMNAKRSNSDGYWKYAFMVPLLLVMILFINKPMMVLAADETGPIVVIGEEEKELQKTDNCAALLRAIKGNDIERVKALLKTVDPNCSYRGDGEPRSPLVAAARQGDLLIGKLLIDAGSDVEFHARGDETPLMAAAANGHLEFVTHLVLSGADINKKLLGDGSALLVAAKRGHLDAVEYLISRGADVNSQVNGDGTPLICAVRNGHYEVSRLLLEHGADPYQVSPGDEYAMHHARMSNNKSMIDLLKKYEKDN
jgi:hypothetical protein